MFNWFRRPSPRSEEAPAPPASVTPKLPIERVVNFSEPAWARIVLAAERLNTDYSCVMSLAFDLLYAHLEADTTSSTPSELFKQAKVILTNTPDSAITKP